MRRILVVDDDLHVRQAISVWLKQHGFRVSTADGGPNGLAALDSATFDLMIVDVFMPHVRGAAAIRLFHERAPTVPLIAISGHAFPDTEMTRPQFLRLATRLGATRWLRKPFKPATLLGVIDECLSEAEPHRRQVATLGAVKDSLSEPQSRPNTFDFKIEVPGEQRRFVGGCRDARHPGFRAVGGRRRNAAKLGMALEGRPACSKTRDLQDHRGRTPSSDATTWRASSW
jgi:DNA-binding response OmpR family regulator